MRGMLRIGCCLALLALALGLGSTVAQAAPETPVLALEMPVSAAPGDTLDVKVRLTDAAGSPIANAAIYFTIPSTFFLGTTSDTVVASANTDKAGWAATQLQVHNASPFTVRAEFRGNDRYASARSSLPVSLEDTPRQLYVQEAGVKIPALGSPPELSAGHEPRTGLASLWPTLSFWPIGLTLAIIWSLYAFVVVQIFRLVGSASRDTEPARSHDRR